MRADSEDATADAQRSLQETYAPRLRCFGCGPANTEGLRIRSFVRGEEPADDYDAEVSELTRPCADGLDS